MTGWQVFQVIVGLLSVGGITGGILAWWKAPAEKRKLESDVKENNADATAAMASAAHDLVASFKLQVDDLNHKLDTANAKIEALQAKLDEERATAQRSVYLLTQENQALTRRVAELERQVR